MRLEEYKRFCEILTDAYVRVTGRRPSDILDVTEWASACGLVPPLSPEDRAAFQAARDTQAARDRRN
jgi:hypothetical protein